MNFLKRFKTLWKLSELTVTKLPDGKSIDLDYKPELRQKSKMAQIIKKKPTVEEEIEKITNDN